MIRRRSLAIGVMIVALVLVAGWTHMATASTSGIATAPAAVKSASVSPSPTPTPSASPSYEMTRSMKVDLIGKLTDPPGLLVLGSSRSMRVDPSFLQTYLGYGGFNCGVSSGSVADAWSFIQLVHDRFPGSHQRYLWLLDPEQFRATQVHRAILAIQQLGQYVPGSFWPTGVNPWPVPTTSPAISKSVKTATATTSPTPTPSPSPSYGKEAVFESNGTVVWNMYDYTPGRTLKRGLDFTYKKYAKIYPKGFTKLRPIPKWFLEHTLALMNSWGEEPVIVLTPYHPDLLKYISKRGFVQRYQEILTYMNSLHAKYNFVLLDYTSIKSFGGWKSGFYDGVHAKAKLSDMIGLHAILDSGSVLTQQ